MAAPFLLLEITIAASFVDAAGEIGEDTATTTLHFGHRAEAPDTEAAILKALGQEIGPLAAIVDGAVRPVGWRFLSAETEPCLGGGDPNGKSYVTVIGAKAD